MSRTQFEHIAQTETPFVSVAADAAGKLVVPDSKLLFKGAFQRVGHDLVIESAGSADVRIPDYFLTSPPADLHNGEGAMIRGDVVELLAGPIAPGQYAQAAGSVAAPPIGQVETLDGSATVQRVDGTVEMLQVGMQIFQRDVLQTEEGASLSVTFVDGTIFTLASASRMVIDELIYDPEASDNSGGFSLIEGGFVFIAGQVAKTGGMDVSTPTSTMGIRGTTVLVQLTADQGRVATEITLTEDPDGTRGSFFVRDNEGRVIANVEETGKTLIVTEDGGVREIAWAAADQLEDSILIAEAFAAYRAAAARYEIDKAFVTFSDTGSTQRNGTDFSDGADTDIDLDSVDDQGVDPIDDPEEAPEVDEQLPFDEGFIPFKEEDDETVIVQVEGLEDSGEETPIEGVAALVGTDSASAAFVLATKPSNGTADVNPDGTFTFVPVPNFNGTDSFTYAVLDDGQKVGEGTVIVEVLPVNDPPTAWDSAATVTEDGFVSGAIEASDIDGDPLTFELLAPPANGNVSLLPNGTFTYAPGGNFEGTDSFGVQVEDPDGATALATVTITVEGENDPPVITTEVGGALGAVEEGAENNVATGQLSAVDPDIDDNVTWSGTSQAQYGEFSIEPDGSWRYTLNNATADELIDGQVILEEFFAVAEDSNGATAAQKIVVTVTGTNDSPILKSLVIVETIEALAVDGMLTALDPDSDLTSLTFAVSPTNASEGAVEISANGSFVYTPADGFLGVDSFEYTVTDAEGGVSTGKVAVAVQSDPGSPENQKVSVSFNESPQPDIAANAFGISVQPSETNPANLAFVLDRSGSIGAADWSEMVSAVASAVTTLAEVYDGSDTSVDVRVITYASSVSSTATYDLQDPELLTAIADLVNDYQGGATRWDLALQSAADFFFNEPANESNYMLFVTDGAPSNGAWVVPYGALTSTTDQYEVTINAFGLGAFYEAGSLSVVDPNAVFLDNPAQLSDAFANTPIFNPELLSFEITLESSDQEAIVFADENSDGLIVEGTNFELPLASIENIDSLLSEANLISITALFDVDNDPTDAEIEIFSAEIIGKAETAQTVVGFDQPDLLFGSDDADAISGGGGNDIILGYDGDDVLSGGSGADIIRAGDGDDMIVLMEAPEIGDLVDGGLGRDVLQVQAFGEIDDMLAALDISGIEAIDMENGQSDALTLSFDEVIELSDTSDSDLETLLAQALPNAHTIYGDTNDATVMDQLVLDGEGTYGVSQTGTVTDTAGNSFDIYAFSLSNGNALATLAVDSDVDVTTNNVVA